MQRTVYAVSQGCYSDYRVRALFDDEADADKHAEALRISDHGHYDDPFVEAFPLFSDGELPERVFVYHVEIIVGPRGGIQSDKTWTTTTWTAGDYDGPPGRRPKVKVGQAPAYGNGWYVRVTARTAEGARKAASDAAAKKRSEMLEMSR